MNDSTSECANKRKSVNILDDSTDDFKENFKQTKQDSKMANGKNANISKYLIHSSENLFFSQSQPQPPSASTTTIATSSQPAAKSSTSTKTTKASEGKKTAKPSTKKLHKKEISKYFNTSASNAEESQNKNLIENSIKMGA